MNETMLICKAIASVAMSSAVAIATYNTGNANCLWALFFVACLW